MNEDRNQSTAEGRDYDRVPDDPAAVERAIEDDDHVLNPEDLQYPELVFEEGDIDDDGGFDLAEDLTYEEMGRWLSDLQDALKTHDLAVESPDGHVRFGVGPKDVRVQFDPDENGRGEIAVTFTLKAATMFVADDPEKPKVGARGGRGFVPIEQLTTDRERFRCYNWIEDHLDP